MIISNAYKILVVTIIFEYKGGRIIRNMAAHKSAC